MSDNREYIVHPGENGNICISEDVVAAIATEAARETEGVACLATTVGKDIAELLGRKAVHKGIRVVSDENVITADICVIVKFGSVVSEVGEAVQKNVALAIEGMTGFSVASVNVHVCGVSMDK